MGRRGGEDQHALTGQRVVSNSSPLISLERIGRMDLLATLFGNVNVPPAVVRETFGSRRPPSWLRQRSLSRPIGARISSASLGPGESEAIGLALESGVDWIVLDDAPGRRLAESMDLPVIGTLGVLLMAKREGVIDEVKPLADALLAVDFRVSPSFARARPASSG